MVRVKLRCIVGCPGLKSSYQEKGLLMILLHNLYSYTITKNKQRVLLWKKPPETFKQKSLKLPKKKFIFSKVAGFKNEFIYTYFSKFMLKV